MNFITNLTVALYFFLPFQFALSPFVDIDLAIIRVYILILLFLFLAISFYKKNVFIPRGWIASFVTLFFMWIFFSLFFSPVFYWTVRKIIFFVSLFPLFYILTAVLELHKKNLFFILRFTVLGALFISTVGIFQFFAQFFFSLNTVLSIWSHLTPFFLGKTFSESIVSHNSWLVHVGSHDLMRSVAFFPDPHIFSFYLGIIAPLALGIFFKSKKFFWLYSFIIIIIADLLTFSRGGYIGLFAGFIAGLVLLWPHISIRIRHFSILLIVSIFFFAAIPSNPITERFLSSFSHHDTSSTHRIELWTQALEEISKKPLLGTGLGAYSYTVNPTADYRSPFYAHNLFLDVCVELGVIGLFFFVGILFSTLYFLYRKRSSKITIFAIISLVVFTFHSLFDTALFSVHIVLLILLIFAIGSRYENDEKI